MKSSIAIDDSKMISVSLQTIWLELRQEKINSSLLQPLFSLLLVLLFLIIRAINKRPSNKKKFLNSPPSPFKLPLIGNLHQLGSFPHRSLRALAQRHGPLMLLHLGQVPTLVVSSADAAREILKTHDHIFSSRPYSRISNRLTYGKSLAFVPYGEYWRQIRKIYVLQLLNSKRVQSFRIVREEETACMIRMIEQASTSSVNNLVDLTDILFLYVNSIICRITLGRKYSEKMEEGKKLKRMLDDMMRLAAIFDVGNWIPWLAWMNYFNGVNAKVEQKFREADEFLDGAVQEHVEKRKEKSDRNCDNDRENGNVENFVDVLLGLDNNDTYHIQLGRDHIKALILVTFSTL